MGLSLPSPPPPPGFLLLEEPRCTVSAKEAHPQELADIVATLGSLLFPPQRSFLLP